MTGEQKRDHAGELMGLYADYSGYIRVAAGMRHAAAETLSAKTIRRRTSERLMRYRNALENRKGEHV